MSATEYQRNTLAALQQALGTGSECISEWSVRSGATDSFAGASAYAPRLDIAVGPFNTSRANAARDANAIRLACGAHWFTRKLESIARDQQPAFAANPNPRCLLGIEIEFSGSSKHILGDFTNASMMGLIGVVIGTEGNIEKVRRVGEYARNLRALHKADERLFTNVVCLSTTEFTALLRDRPTDS